MGGVKTNKISAFTVLELIVAMTVSVIVIAIGYGAFNLINKQYNTQLQQKMKKAHMANFITNIDEDCFVSSRIFLEEDKLVLITSDSLTISYDFNDSTIARNQSNRSDTLIISDYKIEFFFENKEIRSGLVDQFILKIDNYSFSELVINKKYASAELIKFQKNPDEYRY